MGSARHFTPWQRRFYICHAGKTSVPGTHATSDEKHASRAVNHTALARVVRAQFDNPVAGPMSGESKGFLARNAGII